MIFPHDFQLFSRPGMEKPAAFKAFKVPPWRFFPAMVPPKLAIGWWPLPQLQQLASHGFWTPAGPQTRGAGRGEGTSAPVGQHLSQNTSAQPWIMVVWIKNELKTGPYLQQKKNWPAFSSSASAGIKSQLRADIVLTCINCNYVVGTSLEVEHPPSWHVTPMEIHVSIFEAVGQRVPVGSFSCSAATCMLKEQKWTTLGEQQAIRRCRSCIQKTLFQARACHPPSQTKVKTAVNTFRIEMYIPSI